MARFSLVIEFDDPLSETEGPLYAELAASGAVHSLKNTTIVVESAALIDRRATTDRRGLTVDYLEWSQRPEANEEPGRTLEEAVMEEWGFTSDAGKVRRILGKDRYEELRNA